MEYSHLVSVPNATNAIEKADLNSLPRDSVKSLLGFERPKAILYILNEKKEGEGIITAGFKLLNPYGAFETKLLCVDQYLANMCEDAGEITALYHGIQMALLNQVQNLQVRYNDFPTIEQFLINGNPRNAVQSDLINYLLWVNQFIRLEFMADEENNK